MNLPRQSIALVLITKRFGWTKNNTETCPILQWQKKTKATIMPWFSRLLWHPARKQSGSMLGWLTEQRLTSHQTHHRSYRGRFLQVIWPNQQCQSTEGNQLVFQIRLESHQDPPPCYNNTTLGNRLYTWDKGPNVTNPICWTCKNCSHECAADCEHCVTQPSTEQFW